MYKHLFFSPQHSRLRVALLPSVSGKDKETVQQLGPQRLATLQVGGQHMQTIPQTDRKLENRHGTWQCVSPTQRNPTQWVALRQEAQSVATSIQKEGKRTEDQWPLSVVKHTPPHTHTEWYPLPTPPRCSTSAQITASLESNIWHEAQAPKPTQYKSSSRCLITEILTSRGQEVQRGATESWAVPEEA